MYTTMLCLCKKHNMQYEFCFILNISNNTLNSVLSSTHSSGKVYIHNIIVYRFRVSMPQD